MFIQYIWVHIKYITINEWHKIFIKCKNNISFIIQFFYGFLCWTKLLIKTGFRNTSFLNQLRLGLYPHSVTTSVESNSDLKIRNVDLRRDFLIWQKHWELELIY